MYDLKNRFSTDHISLVIFCIFAMTLLSGGCTNHSGERTGTLVVPFSLGNNKSCEDLDVVRVKVSLDKGVYEEEVTCEAGEARLKNIESGVYVMKLYGLNHENIAIMDNPKSEEVTIEENTAIIIDPPARLIHSPAYLKVRWDLGFGTCESLEIDRFQISAWNQSGANLLMESEVSCDEDGKGEGHYRSVSDEARALDGEDFGEVQIQPLDEDNLEIGEPLQFIFDNPKPGREVKLSIHCDTIGCEGSGQPD